MLVDALGLVYRAFYAIPPLSTRNGTPTNALLGFVKTLRNLQRYWKPEFCAVVFDGGIPPERQELLPMYKAQRPPMPDPMRVQLPLIEEYLQCAGVAALRLDDMEADDILAALAGHGAAAGLETLVVTADKDLMQIVTDKVSLIAPNKIEEKINPAAVAERTGVQPAQIPDWLALVGDTSDNIPGVPGVGPKTAARWLAQWPDLETLLAHVSELQPEKSRQTLMEHAETARRNLRLMRLQLDLPGLPPLEALRPHRIETGRLLKFYLAYDLRGPARELSAPTLF
jgi:DNA polymerase-1